MSNLALAMRMQNELGIETIVHVCGRDRNLLGQVAHLLGAHALGIKNLVVITGDPPKMGDFPDATAVYDLDSIGILRLALGAQLAASTRAASRSARPPRSSAPPAPSRPRSITSAR